MLALAARPPHVDWPVQLVELAGIGLVIGGVLLVLTRQAGSARGERCIFFPGAWIILIGLALMLNQHAVAGLGVAALLILYTQVGRGQPRVVSPVGRWNELRECAARHQRVLYAIAALAVASEMIQDALSRGGPRAHVIELGLFGSLLALLGVAWAAAADGPAALRWEKERLPSGSRLVTLGLASLALFVVLGLAVRSPGIESVDLQLVEGFYKSGGHAVTRVVRRISAAGGRDLMVYWIPAVVLGLCLARRARSLRFFLSTMLGTLGLEMVFKTLFARARPEMGNDPHFNSYPSGHVFAATVLAGALVMILLPACRRRWQRVLLTTLAGTWVLVMAAARVYLGAHYPTDTVGGILLGLAWLSLCLTLLTSIPRYAPPASADGTVSLREQAEAQGAA